MACGLTTCGFFLFRLEASLCTHTITGTCVLIGRLYFFGQGFKDGKGWAIDGRKEKPALGEELSPYSVVAHTHRLIEIQTQF